MTTNISRATTTERRIFRVRNSRSYGKQKSPSGRCILHICLYLQYLHVDACYCCRGVGGGVRLDPQTFLADGAPQTQELPAYSAYITYGKYGSCSAYMEDIHYMQHIQHIQHSTKKAIFLVPDTAQHIITQLTYNAYSTYSTCSKHISYIQHIQHTIHTPHTTYHTYNTYMQQKQNAQ